MVELCCETRLRLVTCRGGLWIRFWVRSRNSVRLVEFGSGGIQIEDFQYLGRLVVRDWFLKWNSLCLCLSSPHPIDFQQNVPMIAHSAPIEVPYLHQKHTQALAMNHIPSSTVYLHVPAPLFPHRQFPTFCKSQLTSPTHNLAIPLPHCFYTPILWQ